MSRMQKLKGLASASLTFKTLNDNPYLSWLPWQFFIKLQRWISNDVLFDKDAGLWEAYQFMTISNKSDIINSNKKMSNSNCGISEVLQRFFGVY